MVMLVEYKKMVRIASEEAKKVGISFKNIMGRNRSKTVARSRQNAMKRIYKELSVSYPEVGYFFRRHHTTVMHGVKKEV